MPKRERDPAFDTNAATPRALDGPVANAGIQVYGPLANTSEDDWNNVIDVNVTGTANTVRAALPHMLSRKYGRIVIVSSWQCRHGFKNGSAYST